MRARSFSARGLLPVLALRARRRFDGGVSEAAQDPADLELSAAEMDRLGRSALARTIAHLASLEEMPACGDVSDGAQPPGPAPEEGAPFEALLEELFDESIPRSFLTPGPGYLAYVPGGGLFPGALADLISAGVNRYTGVRAAAPALVRLEEEVLDWFRCWMGFPAGARGLLTPGGSMSNLTAIVTAREERLGPKIRAGTIYVSDQTHHSVAKAAKLAGIAPDRVRVVASDEHFRMRVDLLEAAIERDRAKGLEPFLVVSTAGTTNTGAVDPLAEIGRLAGRHGLWHHVDGAYGAFFRLAPGFDVVLAGLEAADSLALDPHKGLFLPYGTGALLVRDGEALRRTHAVEAAYLPQPAAAGLYDPSVYGPELSRPFRGLRVWLTVRYYGTKRLRAAIAEKHELARFAAGEIRRIPGLVLDAEPVLSTLAFHVSGRSREAENDRTRRLVAGVNGRRRAYLSGCVTKDRCLARICVLCFRTRRRHVARALADLRATAAALAR